MAPASESVFTPRRWLQQAGEHAVGGVGASAPFSPRDREQQQHAKQRKAPAGASSAAGGPEGAGAGGSSGSTAAAAASPRAALFARHARPDVGDLVADLFDRGGPSLGVHSAFPGDAADETLAEAEEIDPELSSYVGKLASLAAKRMDSKSNLAASDGRTPSSPSGRDMNAPFAAAPSTEQASHAFLKQLQQARDAALASGDLAAADALSDAIRTEREELGAHATDTQPQKLSSPRAAPDAVSGGACGSGAGGGVGESRCGATGCPPRGPWRQRATPTRPCSGSPLTALSRGGRPNLRGGRRGQAPASQSVPAPTLRPVPALVAPSDAQEPPAEEGPETEPLPRKPLRLGTIQRERTGPRVTLRAAACLRRQGDTGIANVKGLCLERPRLEESVPSSPWSNMQGSDLPKECREDIAAWAWGQCSGDRCLFAVDASIAPEQDDMYEDGASLRSIFAFCGLPGNSMFLGEDCLRERVFSRPPADVLREALLAVRAEAQVDGMLTVEETDLGLRALQMRAVSNDDSSERILIKVWRELIKAYLDGPAAVSETRSSSSGCVAAGLAHALAQCLALDASDIERQARNEPLESVRSAPVSWESLCLLLGGMARTLHSDAATLDTVGPYCMLGVSVTASDADIKRAYRDLCLKHHPDKGGDTATFQHLQQAYTQIIEDRKRGIRPKPPSKPAKKAKRAEQAAPPAPPPAPPPRREPRTPRERAPSSPKHAPEPPASDAPRARPRARSSSRSRQNDSSTAAPDDAAPADEAPGSADADAEASASADAEAAAEARAKEALAELQRRQADALTASAAAKAAASTAADAASRIAPGESKSGDRVCESACEDMLALASAVEDVATGAEVSGDAAMEASALAAAAGGMTATGSLAEDLARTALDCAMHGTSAVHVALSCRNFAEELRRTATAVSQDARGADDEARTAALRLLASVASRGADVAAHAAKQAALAATSLDAALAAAEAARAGGEPGSGSPERRGAGGSGRGRPPRSPAGPEPAAAQKPRPPQPQRPPSAQRRASRTGPAEDRRPPTPPSADGGLGGDAGGPRASRAADSSPRSSRPQSAGARARLDALVQRRLASHEELRRLDGEIRGLQRKVHAVLAARPLLLPSISPLQRRRVFVIAAEILEETVEEMRTAASPSPHGRCQSSELADARRRGELLPWLLPPRNAGAPTATAGPGLLGTRAGLLRLAACIDLDALLALLQDEFLPALRLARPDASDIFDDIIASAVAGFRALVEGTCAGNGSGGPAGAR